MNPLLHRQSALIRADEAGRTVHGVAVPYGQWTTIEDYSGAYEEQFAVGAFRRSIAERGHKVKLFIQHDTRRLPIGRATELTERPDGLHAAFTLARTRDADEALELVTTGIVDGFSVGFRPLRDRKERGNRVVRVEASLHEVSLVHSPAYSGAVVAGVRAAGDPTVHVELARRRLELILATWSPQ